MTADQATTAALLAVQQEATKAGILIVVVAVLPNDGGECETEVASNCKDTLYLLHAMSHAVEAISNPDIRGTIETGGTGSKPGNA